MHRVARPAVLGALSIRNVSLLAGLALLPAACGGGSTTSGGAGNRGFTPADRHAVEALLAGLSSTSIPSTILALTNESGNLHPTECEVYPSPTRTGAYALFLYWKPRTIPDDTSAVYYAWFDATIDADTQDDVAHVSYSNARVSSATIVELLREHLPAEAAMQSASSCDVQRDGSVTLSST